MSIPVRIRWMTACWAIWLLSLMTMPVHAQFKVLTDPDITIGVSEELVLFLEWDGSDPTEALAVRVPSGWSLLDAATSDDRGQFVPSILEPSERDDAQWFVRSPDGGVIQHGQSIRLVLQTGSESTTPIRVAPARIRGGELESSGRDEALMPVSLYARNPRNDNYALRLTEDTEPVTLEMPRTSDLSTQDSWTLIFRLRSAGLSQTVLSSWTGYESDPYPVEAVVDGGGHVTIFTGRDQRHFAMRSTTPLADGAWHDVAVVHDAEAYRMKLIVDGMAADSLQFDGAAMLSRTMPPIALGDRLEASRADLSAPFRGDLDDVALLGAAIPEPDLKEWVRSGRLVSSDIVWGFDFDSRESVTASGLDWEALRVVPSPLSYRTPASDIRAEQGPQGVLLSFQPGDENVAWYEIEVSTDGESFRPAVRLDVVNSLGGRLEWLDRTPAEAVRHYRVTTHHDDATSETSRVIKVGLGTDEFENRVFLEGNFPNPFNPTTTIRYEVFEREHVRVSVWDLSGQMIAQPVDAEHGPGRYEVGFDAGSLPSGTYFVRLESATGIQTHQMILMK